MTETPLSHTKKGKFLAAAGGLVGGPLGVIVSPIILMIVNYYTRTKASTFKRFTVWALLGVLLAPLCWFPVVAAFVVGTALYVDHVERTDPAKAKMIQDEWFPSDEIRMQRMRENYPKESDKWMKCMIVERDSGGSADNCNAYKFK